jgi:pyruvate/2-oxoglutarate dehydrogenase complex dihydrolipoamide acyltransferase (E2) component
MATEVRLPQWGMGMQEGTILEWRKQVGDPVAEGEELVEVEAAKAIEALLAPAGGVLAKILVEVGEVVSVRTVIAIIADPGEDFEAVRKQ